MTAYHTNLDANAATYRDVRGSYFPNKAALPGTRCCRFRGSPIRPISSRWR
jgi:hypothetical protein